MMMSSKELRITSPAEKILARNGVIELEFEGYEGNKLLLPLKFDQGCEIKNADWFSAIIENVPDGVSGHCALLRSSETLLQAVPDGAVLGLLRLGALICRCRQGRTRTQVG